MSATADPPITQLLKAWRAGDRSSRDVIFEATYEELKRLASIQMGGERKNHTLQPTALVNECYERLVEANIDWQDRAHFLNFAVRAMRRLLIDHARAVASQKRGGPNQIRVTLEPNLVASDEQAHLELLELDKAFDDLGQISERAARAIQLQAYAGSSHQEIAEVLEVSLATVDRELRFARAWLQDRLGQAAQD